LIKRVSTTKPEKAKSSKVPRLDLIPREALLRLAKRFELGLEHYGKDNWRNGLADHEYILERIAHIQNHCAILVEKLEGRIPPDGDDDVGAILWGGAFLSCVYVEDLCQK
jgi:hypothetical protein